MKYVFIGDIHGRLTWKNIIDKESDADLYILAGDYVTTHDDISSIQQIENLNAILEYKEAYPNKIILLRGNHDLQELGYSWAECSGYDHEVCKYMSQEDFKNQFLKLTQWVYIAEDIKTIFSHAGISTVWMKNNNIENIQSINTLEPSPIFGYYFLDYSGYGNHPNQSPVWIRPNSLIPNMPKGWTQVVGHTGYTRGLINIGELCRKENPEYEDLWCCDALGFGDYLVIEDNIFTKCNINNSNESTNL
jgi:hypothetical protein